jgi:hypothetical protein
MKRMLLASLAALSLLFAGCGGTDPGISPDPDINPNPDPPIVGVFKATLVIQSPTDGADIQVNGETRCTGLAMGDECRVEVNKRGSYGILPVKPMMAGVLKEVDVEKIGEVDIAFGAEVDGVRCSGIGAAVNGVYEHEDNPESNPETVTHETTPDGCVCLRGDLSGCFGEDGFSFNWRHDLIEGWHIAGTIATDLSRIRITSYRPGVQDAEDTLRLRTPF